MAVDFGRNVRDIIEDPRYGMLFPGTHIRADNRSAERWQTAQGGVYVSAGVGSGITGRGAHIALIDDPVKSRQESDSETHRNRVWEWYTNVLYTRLMPGGAIILIMTRWHEDDLAGRLLQAQLVGGDPWTVVDLPALAREGDPLRRQAGEALWASWYDEERLQRIRSALTVRDGPRAWEALYQCRPQPDEGDYFHSEWVKWYDWGDPPKPLARYGASDYAVTADGGDFTVHGVVGVSAEGDIYVLDWWRRQTDSGVWVEAAIDLMEKWRHVVLWAEERGQIEKSVGPFLTKRMQERGVFCRREAYTSSADKPTRARAIQGRMSMGKVYFPRDAPWSNRLVSELLRFPAGNHDDQVDVLSLFGRVLDSMHGASTPKREPVRPAGITGGQILSMLEQQRTIGRAGRYR